MHKLNVLKFALAAGIYCASLIALSTIGALAGVPGFGPFADMVGRIYGPYGYSVSAAGAAIGAVLAFGDGFISAGIFAWLYNLLLGADRASASRPDQVRHAQ